MTSADVERSARIGWVYWVLVVIPFVDINFQVVQHGRKCQVNIVKTKGKGWGKNYDANESLGHVWLLRRGFRWRQTHSCRDVRWNLRRGATTWFRFRGARLVSFHTSTIQTRAWSFYLNRKYNVFGRTYLFEIDGYHIQETIPGFEVSYVVDAYHAGNVSLWLFFRFLLSWIEPDLIIFSL